MKNLNEEIGMSQKGIDYVNNMEVKHEHVVVDWNIKPKQKNSLENERIRKQARNAWICIAFIILVTVILNWK